MENFNEYFTEKFEEPIDQKDLHIVVLGKGGEEGNPEETNEVEWR